MTDERKYIVSVGDQAEIWDSDMYAQKGDSLFATHKDANVFELENVEAFDEDPTDKQYLINVGGEQEVWDADMVREKGERLKQAFPDAAIQRISYKDYWGEQATLNREKRAELMKPDAERNARLAELGYYDDMTGEANAYTQSEEGVPQFGPSIGLKPLSSVMSQSPVTGLTTYADPAVAEFFTDDTYADRQAEIARLDAEYEENPSVIAQKELEQQRRIEREQYDDKLLEDIKAGKAKVDATKAELGALSKRSLDPYGANMTTQAIRMLKGEDVAGDLVENEKAERYDSAQKLVEKAKQAREVADKGFWGAVGDTGKNKLRDLATQSDIEAYNEIGTILTRLSDQLKQEGLNLDAENLSDEVFDKYLSEDEKLLILSFFEYNSAMADAQHDMSGWYKGGMIAAESVSFMLEFLATGGIYKGAGKAVTKGMAGALKRWVMKAAKGSIKRTVRKGAAVMARDAVFALAGTAARTVVAPNTYTRMAEKSIEIEDGELHRVKNSFVGFFDSYVENLSEMSGGLIGKALGAPFRGVKMLGKTGLGSSLASRLSKTSFAQWGRMLGNTKTAQALTGIYKSVMPKMKQLGFHGLPEEIGEEYIGNAIRAITIDPNALKDMHEDGNFGAMLIGFAPMTLLGVGGGAATLAAVNVQAAKYGEYMRNMLGSHYNGEQVDHMMSQILGAEDSQQMQDAIDPMIEAIKKAQSEGKISKQQAEAEIKSIYDYSEYVAKNKVLMFARQTRDTELADEKKAQMQAEYGKYWQESPEGTQTVQTATLNDGRTVFVTSAPAADGKITIVDAKTKEIGFANVSDIATQEVDGKTQQKTQTYTMDAFINGEIANERKTSEQSRMEDERNAQIESLRSGITNGTKINLGTEGAPVEVIATGKTSKSGVEVVASTGEKMTIGWEQVADALGKPIIVKTNQQLVDEQAAEIVRMAAERRAKRHPKSETTQVAEQTAEEVTEAVAQEESHIPMLPDGTVNESAFWQQNPEGYAKWNDEQNQDGGADTREQIEAEMSELQAMLKEQQKAQQTSNPAARKEAKLRAGVIMKRMMRLHSLATEYEIEEKKKTWENVIGARIIHITTPEELALYGGEEAVAASHTGARVRGFYNNGQAYVYIPGLNDASEYDEVAIHEVLAHYGLRQMLGKDFDWVLQNVWEMMSEESRQQFMNYPGVVGIKDIQKKQLAAADEYIAHIAEKMSADELMNTEEKSIWRRIIDMIKGWFVKKGVDESVMNDDAIRGLIRQSYAYLAERKGEELAPIEEEGRGSALSAVEQEYETLAQDLTAEEIKAVATNEFNAAQEAYDALAASAPKVETGESAKDFIARKKAYNEQLAEAKAALDARQALMDEIARIDAANAPVLTDAEVLEQEGLGVDTQNDDVRMSVRYVPTEKQREMIIGSIMNVTGRTREEAERWLASETSLAAMINEDLQYLDYVADPKYKAIKDNSDYPQGTVDFNNICRKRLPFTRMFTRLQRRFPNRVFTAEELADIRTIMSKDDLMVACGLCYVEDRRQMVGEVAQSFIDGLQEQFKTYANNPTKKKNAKKFNELIAGDTYVPQVYDLTTQEGLDKLYNEHRGIWEAFQAFNNARGQQSQNLLQGYAEYKREILSWSDKKVKSVNDNGGLRIFSYSDFEAHHLIDVVQIIIDCAAKGVKIQGYTKVPEFARAVANTGIKLNRSLIPLGDTGLVDGQLAFDPVEGIDINDPNFLESNDNVGNILIGINDEQIRIAMADPRIHYIIPYHARQKENIRQKLNEGAWTNYISTQNERNISDGKRVKDNINIYTDILTGDVTTDRQFVEKYLQLCKEKGRIPKFDQFLERDAEGNYLYTPGYYKFLVDFKLFDENGNILPQQPVVAEFDDAFNMQILENYAKDERESTGEQMNETYDKIVDALGLDESAAEGEDVRFSINKEFNAMLDAFNEDNADTITFNLGRPSQALLLGGVKDMPIKLYGSKLLSKMKKHGFSAKEVKDLPLYLENPIAIFNNHQKEGDRSVLIDLTTNDGNFLVALHFGKGSDVDFNIVRSAFGKKEDSIVKWIEKGFLTYVNKEKALNYLHLSAPIAEASEGQGLSTAAKIVNDFVNPNIASENEGISFSARTDEQREKLFENAKARFGLTNNFKVAGYMLPDGSLLDFSEANDGGDPNQRTLDHREIEGIIMDEGREYDSRWMYLADFMNEGAIRLLPEYAGINLMKAPTKEQRSRLFDFIYKYNGEVILEIADERLNNVAYVEYDRRTSPSRIFRDIDGYFNEGIVPQQDIRFSFIGERGAAALDKADEATVRLDDLAVARQMEEAGKDAKEIKMATGWERGAEGKWKYEIMDNNFYLADNWKQATKLGDAIEHDELFAAYPELKDITVTLDATANVNRGGFTRETNSMFVQATNESNLKHSLIHEIQHAIQMEEGFARGSSPFEMAKRDGTDTFMLSQQHMQSMKDALQIADSMDDKVTVDELKEWIKSEEDAETRRILTDIYTLMSEGSTIQDVRRLYLVDYNKARRALQEELTRADSPYSKYTRVMGEVEARNVSNRRLYDIERRRNTLASETEDIAREDQIFLEGAFADAVRFSAAENRGIYKGKRFWIGSVSLLDGYIEEVHTFEEAERTDFHHSFYFSDPQLRKIADEENAIFWIDDNGEIEGDWRTNIPINIKYRIKEQITIVDDDTRFSVANDNQAIFVSNAARAVEGVKMEKATPAQWLAMIEKNGGLKAGEDKWMGLSDWLKASDRKTLTKAEVLEFVNEHAIKIEETHYDAYAEEKVADAHAEMERILQDKFNAYREEYYEQNEDEDLYGNPANDYAIERLREEFGDEFPYAIEMTGAGDVYLTFPYEEDEDMRKWSEKLGVEYNPQAQIEDMRLGYTTDGLTNKREIALTVPTIEPWGEEDITHFGDAGEGRAVAWVRFGETKIYANTKEGEEYKAFVENMLRRYHIDEDVKLNRFGTIVVPQELLDALTDEQFNELQMLKVASMEASDKTEKTVLVIDEIQSKRHQEGREQGYARGPKVSLTELKQKAQDFEQEMINKYHPKDLGIVPFASAMRGVWTEEESNTYSEMMSALGGAAMKNIGIPDAPFEKNWHELAMKRMLRYAAENGYDYIAWTKGEQQAERYNIGNVVEEISLLGWRTEGKDFLVRLNESDTLYEINTSDDAIIESASSVFGDVNGKPLSDIVGKEMADKMMSMHEDEKLAGEELRVGGEGMKGFYDKMLPAFMNKYGKKWGVKVADITLPDLEEAGRVMHSVPVTEEMKASVMEGQVMFSAVQIDPAVREEMDRIAANAIIDGNYMLAPNGQPTKLTADQWAMVRTKNFISWFGDWINDPESASKVVDENGEPKVVFHGSTWRPLLEEGGKAAFKMFEGLMGKGAYFTDDFTTAYDYAVERYAEEFGEDKDQDFLDENGYITEVFLNIRNDEDIFPYGEETRYVARYPNQIKSATETTGLFSESGDIRFSFRPVGGNSDSNEASGTRFSVRTNPAPVKTQPVYKLMRLGADGKLYPLFIGSAEAIELGVWYDADSPNLGDLTRLATGVHLVNNETGEAISVEQFKAQHPEIAFKGKRPNVDAINWATANGMRWIEIEDKAEGQKRYGGEARSYFNLGINGSGQVGQFAMRPGWHAGSLPTMRQIGKGTDKYLRDDSFVWVKGRVPADIDYQAEADANPDKDIPTHIPVDGYYMKATNANAAASQADRVGWYVAGSFIADEIISDEEARRVITEWNENHKDAQVKYDFRREGGMDFVPGVGMVETTLVPAKRAETVVAEGLNLTDQEFARLAGEIFAALPETWRKGLTDKVGNILDMPKATMQTVTRLAEKEDWTQREKELAKDIRNLLMDIIDPSGIDMERPLTTKEALWMLYNALENSADIISEAKRSVVAHNLGFDTKSVMLKKKVDDNIRYSVVQNGRIDAATDMYNYEANLWINRLAESWLDMNQSVIALQDALAEASGKPIESWEDVVLALNQLSSKSYADKKKYMRDFLQPLWDAVMDIVRNTDFKIEDIERYMMLKHGLERNEKFAKRDAKQFYKEMFDKVADRMKNTSHAEQVVALSEAKKRIADIDAQIATAKGKKLKDLQEARERAVQDKEIAELVLRGDEKQNEQDLQDYYDDIDNELNQKYWEFREKDYGGLTSMFQEKLHDVKRKDYKTEEAYQKALLASVKPKYDTVAEMESAAKDEVIDFEEAVPSYYDLWKKVNAATKEVLRHQHASGVITTEQYDAVRNMFRYYVPLRGFADNTAVDMYSYYMDNSAGGFAKPIIAAKGRKTRAESPLGWIGAMAESAIQQDNKNEAKMKLYYALMNRPDTGVLSLSEMWYVYDHTDSATGKKVFVPAYPPATGKVLTADEMRQHMDAWEQSMKAKQAIGEAYRKEQGVNLGGSVIFQDTAQEAEHVIRVKVAGKDYSVLVNGNPRAAQAINGLLNPDANVGPVGRWYGELRRGMSSLMTSFSPLFWVANYQRDLLSSFMRTSEREGWGQAFKYLANRLQAWRVAKYVYAYENGTMGDSYYEKLYKEFAENGGITGYTVLTTNKEYEKLLEDYAKHVDQKVLNWIRNVWEKFMGFGEAIEQVSRFAAYITAREAGNPIAVSVAAAKEVSVNFNRKGSAAPISLEELDKLRDKNGKPLNAPRKAMAIVLSAMPKGMKELYFFFNASIQALSSSAKLAKKSPGKAMAWAGMYMGLSVGLAFLNYLLADDDDDNDYLDLPDYLRHSTALIKVSDDYYFKWSLPQEMRPFYATADILVSKAMGKMPHKTARDVGRDMALAVSEWLPVNPFGTEDPILALVPDAFAPLGEIKANQNSFGGRIYNDMSFKSEAEAKQIPAYRKGTSKTGEIYVDMAEFLNDISGGDEVQKGWLNVNPAIVEHLVEGYGGGIYDFAKMMITLPGLIASDEPLEVRDIPFVSKVLLSTDETNMNSHVNEAFNHYQGIADNARRVENEYRKSDDPSRADDYMAEDDWRIYLLFRQYDEDLKMADEKVKDAVDDTEKDLAFQEQNVIREMLLNDIARGVRPSTETVIKVAVESIRKETNELLKPSREAEKKLIEAKKRRDKKAAEVAKREFDSLKDLPEYKKGMSLKKDLDKIKRNLDKLQYLSPGVQRDSVLDKVQRDYDALVEKARVE